MKQYVCVAECYAGQLYHVGDVVDERVLEVAPARCFSELNATEAEAVRYEIAEKTGMAPSDVKPEAYSNADIVEAKKARKIAGNKEPKVEEEVAEVAEEQAPVATEEVAEETSEEVATKTARKKKE